MTFPELCEWYWDHHGQHKRWNGIQGSLKRFAAFFGPIPLVAITPELISEYVAVRIARDRIKPITATHDLQLLKSMFNLIINYKRWRRVLENPVVYVKLAREDQTRVRFLEPEDIHRLLGVFSCRPPQFPDSLVEHVAYFRQSTVIQSVVSLPLPNRLPGVIVEQYQCLFPLKRSDCFLVTFAKTVQLGIL